MDLSTSELQAAALSLYPTSGYVLMREEVMLRSTLEPARVRT